MITTRFNGATAFLPWKSTTGSLRATSDKRFNGATAFLPWKSPRQTRPLRR